MKFTAKSFVKKIHYTKRVASVASLILLIISVPLFAQLSTKVQVGTFTPAKVTISDSRASNAAATYAFAYTTSVTTSIKQFDVVFCTTASGACSTPTGMTTTGATRAIDNVAGTGRTDDFTGNGTLSTVVTTPASQATQAVTVSYTGITNPSTTDSTFFARITTYSDTGSTVIDSASVAFAILTTTSIAVTASVASTFTFSVAAVTTGSVNGATVDVTGSTANSIPFGTLSTATPKIAAHDLTVTTNATNGYTITVKAAADPPLVDSTNNIDAFSGTNATPTTWSSPAGSAASVNTGFFGYTTNDASLGTGTATRFTASGGNKWSGTTTSPLEVAYSATGIGSSEITRVGWQAEVNGLQPAGAYSGTVILVATPTY
jgi:hypothetical protein